MWSVCRSLSGVRSTMRSSLRGWEPDLRGYWPLVDGDKLVADRSPYNLHGILQGPFSRAGCLGGWISPSVSAKACHTDATHSAAVVPVPVMGHFHSVVSSLADDAADQPFKGVAFAGPSALVGLRARLWDSRRPGASSFSGSMWLRDRVNVNHGFELQTEVTALTDGTQVGVVTLRVVRVLCLPALCGPGG